MNAERDEARESPAVREGVIAAIMGGFFAFVVIMAVVLFFFFESLAPNTTHVKERTFPSPRLQTRSDGLRDSEIVSQQADLQRFRWINRAHGIFQIPIERAMRLVAARGANAYAPVLQGSGRQSSQENVGQGSQANGGPGQ